MYLSQKSWRNYDSIIGPLNIILMRYYAFKKSSKLTGTKNKVV